MLVVDLNWTRTSFQCSHLYSFKLLIPVLSPMEDPNNTLDWIDGLLPNRPLRYAGHSVFKSIQMPHIKRIAMRHNNFSGDLQWMTRAWWWLLSWEEQKEWNKFAKVVLRLAIDKADAKARFLVYAGLVDDGQSTVPLPLQQPRRRDSIGPPIHERSSAYQTDLITTGAHQENTLQFYSTGNIVSQSNYQ